MTTVLSRVVHCLSRRGHRGANEPTDADLLDRFRTAGEEAAFTLLVQRHGPAVLGVCRRVLGNAADADDAFQATFVVLLRKAGAIRRRASLGSFLYGVAYRLARKAQARRTRPAPPLEAFDTAGPDPVVDASFRELTDALDQEICRLPEKYRAPLVLCGLEGMTCEQAARELCWPKSSLAHRLAKARALLHRRLSRRGFGIPAAALAALLTPKSKAAPVPLLLTLATVRLARNPARGTVLASDAAVALAEQALRGATARWWIAVVGLISVSVAAAGLLMPSDKPDPKAPPSAPPAAPPEQRTDREGFPLPAEALARVGSARLRHGGRPPLQHLEYSPDGTLLASSGGGRIRLWDAATGNLVRQVTVADGDRILPGGLFSADGRTFVARDGEVCRWFDTATGKEVRWCSVTLPKTDSHACFTPHGNLLAVVDTRPGKDLVVYELPSGKERFRRPSDGAWFWELAFSPDGAVLAAVAWGGGVFQRFRVHLFDTASGKPLGAFPIGEVASSLTFSPDGKKLLLHNFQKAIRIWEVPGGKLVHGLEPDVNALVTAAFAPDGASIAVGTQGMDAIRLDLATGKDLARFRTHPSSRCVAFAPDGKTLAVGTGDGILTQWDPATGKRLAASADPISYFGHLDFDAGGKRLWAWTEVLEALDWRTGRVVKEVRIPHERNSWNLALTPERARAAGINAALKPAVWDTASGKELCVLEGANRSWSTPAFSPDGQTVYAGEWSGQVRAWDARTGKERPAFDKERRFTFTLVVSPDGRRLAAADHPQVAGGSRREITMWELPQGREAHRLLPPTAAGQAWGLAFSRNGTRLAAVGGDQHRLGAQTGGFLAVWNAHTGEQQFARTGLAADLRAVAFSPDGRMLVTGGNDGAVRLWETATGQERHHFTGHETTIFDLAVSPDSKLVAAASADAPLFVWDVTGSFDRQPSAVPLSADDVAALWNDLRDADAAVAFRAMRRMMARPVPAVALLRERLRPAAAVREEAVLQLLRGLDAEDFAAREKAAAELEEIADRVESVLREVQKGASPEARRRIERALQAAGSAVPQRRRQLRAVEVLERVGTAEARDLLKVLAGGTRPAFLTWEARAALDRLKGQ
jgi:RNA polymerase sigma factor (sigma-70 family)